MRQVPKIIWILWFQGYKNAPDLVKRCYKTWTEFNPNYDVIFLNSENLSEYLPFEVEELCKNANITIQAQSDIIRISLLAKHGGIWADSSMICYQSLDSWLYKSMTSGFFCFSNPRHDRLIASWFLAAEKNNYLVTTFSTVFNQYWKENPKLRPYTSVKNPFILLPLRVINQILKKKRYWWFTPLMMKYFKVYPYFIFHYLFEALLRENTQFFEIWEQTPTVSAKPFIHHKKEIIGMPLVKYSHHR